jgi:hypothetical protein
MELNNHQRISLIEFNDKMQLNLGYSSAVE